MPDYDHDQDPYDYDDDERFYEETVYNEEYYIERERELIRQSNLDLELEEIEERHIREIREEGLLRPVLVKRTLSANVLDNGWYVNIHCQTHLPKGYAKPTVEPCHSAYSVAGVEVAQSLPMHVSSLI